MNLKNICILIVIFLVALFLKFHKIDSVNCLNLDEAAFGYNAYSLLLTGKDEYGIRYPFEFKSIGDYKTPLFSYMLVPLIKIFGLNEFSVRFWPAFFGSLTIIPIFFITDLIFKNRLISNLAAIFLAVSPWHLQFTRGGFEAGISSFLVCVGILTFIVAAKGKKDFYVISFSLFILSMYAYFSERVFSPVMLIFLLFYFRKEITKNVKILILCIFTSVLLLSPLIPVVISSGQKDKILITTFFGYKRSQEYLEKIKSEDKGEIFYYLFHTDLFEKSWGIINRYLNHISFDFLFAEGAKEDPRQMIVKMGLLYYYDLPLVLIGLYYLLKHKIRGKGLIFGWLLIAPVSSIFTRDLVSARRSLNMVYPLIILSSYGAYQVFNFIKKTDIRIKILSGFSLFALFVFSLGFYFLSYYIFTPERTFKGPGGWQCGYKELVNYMQNIKGNYKKIVIDTSYQGPYIFFLFYEKYDPAQYQKQAKLVQEGSALGEGAGYDNYTFRPIYWPQDRCYDKVLYVGPPERLPEKDLKEGDVKIINNIYFKNKEKAWVILETLKERTH